MAKKADGNTSTARIRYSQAKALVGEYLGDPNIAEREIRKELATGEIPWWCVRFESPPQYSGPGSGDPKFWREPDNLAMRLEWLVIRGDYARHINGAAASGIDLDHSALVKLKLLPPDDAETALPRQHQSGKSLIEAEVKRRAATGERWDSITALSEDLCKWMKNHSDKPLAARTIEHYLRKLGLFSPLSKK